MSKKILSILLVLFTIITAFVTSQAAAPKKFNDTYIVDYGSTVNFLGSQATIKTNDNSIASVSGNSLKIVGIGHFDVTAVTNGKEENFKFFAWNAYLRNGKYYTYNDEARKSKSDVLYSKTYLALSATKNNNAFKVEDYLFETGKYKGELKGKYLTSYYDRSKDISSTSNIVYSFTDDSTVTEIKLSSYDNNDGNKPVDYKINLNKTSLNMNVGDKETLKETVTGGYDGSVTWTSTDTSIVSVEKGTIKAIKPGTATVKATISNGSQASCKVTVKVKNEEDIPVVSIKLDKENATITVPEGKFSSGLYSLKLNATFSPSNATKQKITWSSSNNSVASVNSNGLVTPKKAGTVTITAKTENGKKATCIVNIKTSIVNLVKTGSTVKIKNAKIISIDNTKIARVVNGELKIIGSGTFKAIVEVENKKITLDFFAWNAYLKSGKYYTYNEEARKSKSDVLYSKTYLALSTTKNNNAFKVEDYLFETGKYNGELKGKYLTNYYDSTNNKSRIKDYEYSFKENTAIINITISDDLISVDEEDLPIVDPDPTPPVTTPPVTTPPVTTPPVTTPPVTTPPVTTPPVTTPPVTTPPETISGKLEIHFIDPNSRVDAIYIKVGNKTIFIDGGFHWDADAEISYLKRLGVNKIDYYIASHAHSNHVGAAGPIIREFNIGTIYSGPQKYDGINSAIWMMKQTAKKYGHANKDSELAAIEKCDLKVINVGDTLNINGLKIICLGPLKPKNFNPEKTAENANSLILRLEYGNHSFLLAGDTDATQLKNANTEFPGMLDVDVYKNSHHNATMSKDVLNLISPRYIVFTTNDKSFPSSPYRKTISKICDRYFTATTNTDKNILIESNGTDMKITTKYNVPGVEPIKIDTTQKGPSGTVVQSYSDSSIKVSVEKISEYYVTRIWLKDPSKQLRKQEAGWGEALKTVNEMLNATEKTIVGCNASGFYLKGSWTPKEDEIKKTPWNKTTEGFLVITNGVIRREIENKNCNALLGVLPNGSLKYYENNPYSDVHNDGVKNTFTFGPLLIKDGQPYKQVIGSPRQSYAGSGMRTTIGQIDSNNYVIITTKSKATLNEIATLGVRLGCQILYNLDGGGSTTLWFRGKLTGNGTQVMKSGRAVADALCFVSLEGN